MAIGTSIAQLKIACFGVLKGDSTLLALVTGIFDQQAPTNQAFRYITLDSSTELSDNTMGKGGRECTLTWSVYTQDLGSSKGLTIADRMITLIDHQMTALTALMTGQSCRYAELDNLQDSTTGNDIPTYRAIVRFRFKTQEN